VGLGAGARRHDDEEEARESKFRHIITRSVGFEREVLVDGAAIPIQAGDCYLICSTGCRTTSSRRSWRVF